MKQNHSKSLKMQHDSVHLLQYSMQRSPADLGLFSLMHEMHARTSEIFQVRRDLAHPQLLPGCLIFNRFKSIPFLRTVNHYGNVKKGATIHHGTTRKPKETYLQSFPCCLLVELHMLQTLLMCTQQRVLDVRVWQILGVAKGGAFELTDVSAYRSRREQIVLDHLASLRSLQYLTYECKTQTLCSWLKTSQPNASGFPMHLRCLGDKGLGQQYAKYGDEAKGSNLIQSR